MKAGEYAKWGEHWPTATALTEHGDKLYIVNDEKLYRIDPADGKYVQVGDELWRPKAMFAAHGALYLISNDGSLYRIDPVSGAYKEIDRYTWANVQATAVVRDNICVINDGSLYVVNGTDGTYRLIAGDPWNPRCMQGFNNLFIVDNDGTMFKVQIEDGKYFRNGDKYAWPECNTFARIGSFGYLVNDGTLWKCTPAGGARWQVSEETWELKFLVGCQGDLFGLMSSGTMYRIGVDGAPGA